MGALLALALDVQDTHGPEIKDAENLTRPR
jgi:hypothetical protein